MDFLFIEANTTVFYFIFLVSLIALITTTYFFTKNSIKDQLDLSKHSIFEPKEQFYELLFLFFGLAIPLIEIVLNIFSIRSLNFLSTNLFIGALLLTIYLLCKKVPFFNRNLANVFMVCFFGYSIFLFYKLFFISNELISFVTIIVSLFISYFIFKNIISYWFYILTFSIVLIVAYFENLMPLNQTIVLFCSMISVISIHLARHFSLMETRNKFLFTNDILHNSNSIILATNIKGEVIFCGDSIKDILGYESSEVMGLNYWNLTKDKEFIGKSYHENFVDNRLYVRKLTCKDGSIKHIQWKDKKYSKEVIIGIGHDITDQINAEFQYRNLIETAIDMIYEVNQEGEIIYSNPYTNKVLGYTESEIFKKKFYDFVREDYRDTVKDYYKNIPIENEEYQDYVLPITTKSGTTVWISQKVTFKKNSDDQKIYFTAIARDVTLVKNLEQEHYRKSSKIKTYNEIIKRLTSKSHSNDLSFNKILKYILQTVAVNAKINRVSYWQLIPEGLRCVNMYFSDVDRFEKNFFLEKDNYPIYFSTLESSNQLVASNVYENKLTQELALNYLSKNKINSLLDTPIFINNQIEGILSFETVDNFVEWDNDDINFAKSIADIIAIAIETQIRQDKEEKLVYRNDILNEVLKNTEQFLQSNDTKEIITNIIPAIGNITQVDVLAYYRCREDEKQLEQTYRWVKGKDTVYNFNESILKVPFQTFPEVIEKLKNKEHVAIITRKEKNKITREFLENLSTKSVIYFPIFVKNKLYSCLIFTVFDTERIWFEEEINTLKSLTNSMALSIERNLNETLFKENEERFRLLANNIPGAVHLSKYDTKWTKLFLNDEIEKLTGYPKESFLSQEIFYYDLVHPDDLKTVTSKASLLFENHQKVHLQYRIIKKDGSIRWVEEFGEPVYKNGQIENIVGIFIDITDRVEAEKAIKEKQIAQAASKAKSDFLAAMSHEIRTPLNGIVGFTKLLMQSDLDASQLKYMNTVNQSAISLIEIINNILDLSKIEAGKLELLIEKQSLRSLLNQIVDVVSFDIKTKDLDFLLHIDNTIPDFIYCDYVRMKQILFNLLSNATKFTSKGTITLNVQKIKLEKNNVTLKISVSDTGIGIKEKNIHKIFEAFTQEESTTTKNFGGTGLGLSITNQLLELMKSKLQLKSTYGKGSEFFFEITVPYTDNSLDDNPLPKQTEQLNYNQISNIQMSIAIAEDNKINMLLTKTLIKQLFPKASISGFENGKELIKEALNNQFDFILMDVQMPIKNGYETTRELRQLSNYKHIPIIALSAGIFEEEKQLSIESGMNDFVPKPIDKENLKEVMHHWISKTLILT